jgi:hypothetical protein
MFTKKLKRMVDGYMTEKKTIYEQLQDILQIKIEPAPDEWNRLFNVNLFIKLNEKFTEKYGGKVFYIFSIKDYDKKKNL